MFFEFEASDGKKYSVETNTHEAHLLEDEEVEVLLYDENNPAEAMMFDSMPSEPESDVEGNIKATGFSVAFGALLVPILAIAGNIIYLAFLILDLVGE